jgi:hypothetical protein
LTINIALLVSVSRQGQRRCGSNFFLLSFRNSNSASDSGGTA